MIFIKSKLTPELPGEKEERNPMSNQQLQQLTQQVNGASDVLTAISETLPERPSRAKLRSQLESVLAVLQSVSRQLNAEIGRTVETHTTSSVGNAQGVSA